MQVFALALVRIRQACLAGVGHVLPLFNAMTCVHALQALVCYRHACGVVWMVLACGTDGVASASSNPFLMYLEEDLATGCHAVCGHVWTGVLLE